MLSPRCLLVFITDVGVVSFLSLFRPKGLNRCGLTGVALGTFVVDLVMLRVGLDLVLLFLRTKVEVGTLKKVWDHISFIQLVYALSKGVGRALGARSRDCSDDTNWFDAACFAFAIGAYVTPSMLLKELETKSSVPDESRRSTSMDSTLSGSPYVALLETGGEPSAEKKDSEEEKKSSSGGGKAVKGILQLSKPEGPLFVIAMAFAVIAALASSAVSLWSGEALDALIKHGSGKEFKARVLQLAVITAVGSLCTGCRGGVFSIIGVRINVRIRDELFRHLLRLELGFFDVTPTGDLNSRLSSDTAKIGDVVSLNVNVFVRTLVQLCTTFAFMVNVSPELTFVACASIPVVGMASQKYGEYVWNLSKAMQDRLADSMKIAEEVFSSILTVRSLAGEKCVAQDFRKALDKYAIVGNQEAGAYALWQSFNTALPNLMTCLLLYYGGQLVDKGALRSGRLVAFMLLTQSLASAFAILGDMYSNLADAFGAADKVFELLAKVPNDMDEPNDPLQEVDTLTEVYTPFGASKQKGHVDIHDVHFRYPSRPDVTVLKGVSLSVKPGSIVAFTGQSGSGKSSILSLVQYFYAPEMGTVSIDGRPVAEIPHAELHRVVALVGQEPVLFSRSVERNVKYGLEGTAYEPSAADVKDVLQMAHALEFIEKMPDNLDTDVGERGATMSGGQKQRIAIARALARKPSVLLLDEATSALDAESERNVQSALDDLIAKNNLTVLVVAHRLSTIRNADSICCMVDGLIVEQGTHDDLMTIDGGVYQDLVRRQGPP